MAEIQGLPPLPKCFSDLSLGDSSVQSDSTNGSTLSTSSNDTLANGHVESSFERQNDSKDDSYCQEDHQDYSVPSPSGPSPFSKLNSALSKLKEEMVGLRKLDMSLLTQLWSLNDAIQEYKAAVQDRYSETNSEYSWGMNSRTSSIGSIDEYDWNEDIHLKSDNNLNIGSSLHSSTSSLLQQINQLTERAESEF